MKPKTSSSTQICSSNVGGFRLIWRYYSIIYIFTKQLV